MPKRGFLIAILVLGLIGLADSSYLTFEKFQSGPVPCIIGSNCDIVTTSTYSQIGPIPLSALGMAFYLAMAIGSLVVLETRRSDWFRMLVWLSVAGAIFSLYLLYLQAFVIKAYCVYCLLSAGTSIGLFAIGLLGLKSARPISPSQPPSSSTT